MRSGLALLIIFSLHDGHCLIYPPQQGRGGGFGPPNQMQQQQQQQQGRMGMGPPPQNDGRGGGPHQSMGQQEQHGMRGMNPMQMRQPPPPQQPPFYPPQQPQQQFQPPPPQPQMPVSKEQQAFRSEIRNFMESPEGRHELADVVVENAPELAGEMIEVFEENAARDIPSSSSSLLRKMTNYPTALISIYALFTPMIYNILIN